MEHVSEVISLPSRSKDEFEEREEEKGVAEGEKLLAENSNSERDEGDNRSSSGDDTQTLIDQSQEGDINEDNGLDVSFHDELISNGEETMGKCYSPHSGNEGDDETDANIDFPSQKGKVVNNRYSNVSSSIDSLDGAHTDGSTEDTKLSSAQSNHNDANDRTLPRDMSHEKMFNIMPSSASGHCTFIPGQEDGVVSRGSSAGFSCDHNMPRDTDSDNTRHRHGVDEYHSSHISRPLIHPRPMHMSNSFSSTCHYCHDNQSQVLPQHAHHSHQGSSCSCGASAAHTPNSFSHYHQNIPHQLTRSQTNSKYHSGSYEPPWDLVYPSLSQLGVLQQQHNPAVSYPNHALPHDNLCTHNSAATNVLGSVPNQQSPYRASNSLVSRSMSNHDRLALQNGSMQQQRANNGSNTLATTTGSHSYETPWDMGDSSKVLAYWQGRQSSRNLHGTTRSTATTVERHIPPPSSPPPPPPESLRRPVVHYDGAALVQANLVQNLPQKKPTRRQCNWRCIGIFLMLAIVILAGCVAAFTYLLVGKDNSVIPSRGGSLVSGPVTDGNLGDRHRSDVPPYDFVKVRFYMAKSQFYKFNISLSSNATVGVYGRRSVQPTHIQYSFVEAISGQQISHSLNRPRRSTPEGSANYAQEVNSAFVQYLEEGYWYISFYNDGNSTQGIRFTVSRHDKMSTNCPNDCYGKGDCDDGVCKCYHGYHGVECNLNACPVLCSGNGVYEEGLCKCFDSWKGTECSIQAHQCHDCLHGRCVDGHCSCAEGWKGAQCDEVDCPVSDCSGHGICSAGRCYCEMGYRGVHCSVDEMKNFTIACSNDCSGHGTFDPQLQTCTCDGGWMGRNCEQKECSVECVNGHCYNGHCLCNHMWEGVMCTQRQCDDRCNLHGVCDNGTCNCQPGWNGKHCTLSGCPLDCNSQGNCEKVDGEYICSCGSGWKGKGCDIATELECSDHTDNDGDNLVDCLDPDCCANSVCADKPYCRLAPEPVAILQSKQRLSAMASFYDSKKFLVEGGSSADSIQTVTDITIFDPKRVSVIRGTVLLRDGSPALGTRVDLPDQLSVGFTLTRENGTFDLMVNGGGSVTVRFVRGPDSTTNTTVILAWNTLVTLDPVTILQGRDRPVEEPNCSPDHDRYTLYPVVLPTWQHTQLRTCPELNSIIPESQVAQESIAIPGTDTHLLYKTSDSAGYRSTILIQLTSKSIPHRLSLVHMRVVVEGVVHTQVFEADPNLTYRYSWNRQNAYQQNVYGIVTAQVSVGYQYKDCEKVIWDKQATTLSGFLGGDLSASDRSVAQGWSLDIQHFYNYQEGILHKGDGTNIYLKEKPELLNTVLGTGSRRSENCPQCNGDPTNSSLLAPLAVASDLDGAVYVADYNIIRRLPPDMKDVRTVLELRGASVSHRYYMAVSPTDGKLYISDFLNKQVLRMKHTNPDDISDVTTNYEVIAGNGQRCIRGSGATCGDGGDAKLAELTHPKGIAVNSIGEIYFVDESRVRKIGLDGVIDTFIGNQDPSGQYVPMPCGRAAELYEVHLGWPTSIAFSPIDGSLHILDQTTNLILKMTSENKVSIVAGRPSHCPQVTYKKAGHGLLGNEYLQSLQARNNDLMAVMAMTFAPDGNLYIIESDESRINRVRAISTDGYISHYAGAESKCNCEMESCQCWDPKETIAAKALLNSPMSLTVTPDGVLYIADFGNLRVHSVISVLPTISSTNHYEVISSDDGQLYRFNRNGFHVRTSDLMTNSILYNFTMYPPNSLDSALFSVSAKGGQTLQFNRNEEGRVVNISVNGLVVGRVQTNQNGELHRFTNPDGITSSYNYELNTGLLMSKKSSRGEVYFYEYDDTGRLAEVILPTGELTKLQSSVEGNSAMITLSQNDAISGTATYNGNYLSLSHGSKSADISYANDGSIVVQYPSGLVVALETGMVGANPHTSLKRKTIASAQGPVHRLEWRYYIKKQSVSVSKKMRVSDGNIYNYKNLTVNGDNLLSLKYLTGSQMEIVKDGNDDNIMQIVYDPMGAPTFLAGHVNKVAIIPVNITYNRAGQMVAWKHDRHFERREYNSKGQLLSVKLSNLLTTSYSHIGTSLQPSSVRLPSGVSYQIKYDSLGNLIEVVNPSGQRNLFEKSVNLGFVRQTYQLAGRLYVEDMRGSGQIFRQIYPSQHRRVYRRYTVDDRPSEILYDSSRISYIYHPLTYSLTNVSLSTAHLDCQLYYRMNGSLYDQHTVSLTSKKSHIQFVQAQFRYKYNKFLRVTNIQGTLQDGSRTLQFVNLYEYSTTSGLLSGTQDFTLGFTVFDRKPLFYLSDSRVYVERLYDKVNLLYKVRMRTSASSQSTVHEISYTYDSLRRITSWTSASSSDSYQVQYQYLSDNDVTQMTVVGNATYKYGYNAQGSISEIVTSGRSQRMTIDSQERVTGFNGHTYRCDQDGFLVAKDDIRYEFNSQGQLIHALENGKMDVTYHYDSIGRLLTRKDNYGSTIQLVYADIMNPSQITHVYNFTSRQLISLLYDDLGFLMAVEDVEGSVRRYVMTDSRGTPLVVYNSNLELDKTVHYTAYGEVITDTHPSLQIFLGFQGGFYDSVTKLVLLSERWYYPELGRWMDSRLPGVFDRLSFLSENPSVLNGYKLQHPINVHLMDKEAMYMRSTDTWLKALGYNLDVLAPRMTFQGRLTTRQIEPVSERALLPLVSAFQCAYAKDMDDFLELSLMPRHKLISSVNEPQSSSLIPSGSLFSQGIVLALSDNRLSTQTLGSTPAQETLLATRVLDGAEVLGLNYTSGGKVTHYLLKPNLSDLDDDLTTMGMSPTSNLYLENGVRVQATTDTESNTGQLIITGNTTVISVRYGASRDQEVTRILSMATSRAVEYAWRNEITIIDEGRRSQYPWTSAEINELKRTGKVDAYSYRLIQPAQLYPELADSPFNIQFLKL